MREKIYTIPVTDAFKQECECPVCTLERNLEEKYTSDLLNHSVMDPHTRIETNDKGFCRLHYEFLYSKQFNRLQLGLLIDTHLWEQNSRLKKLYYERVKISSKRAGAERFIDELVSELASQENKCTLCSRISHFMHRYIDIILLLWFKEDEFRALFRSRKGFCKKHFRLLLEGARKYSGSKKASIFLTELMSMQLENLERVREEVNWFTQKFAYHNKDAPWGNSKDSLVRSIQKIVGTCDLK